MEGVPSMFGTINRKFNAGDMYLTARLDGPKKQGQSAIFAVRAMLERAKRASSPSYGVNPLQAVAVLDDVPSSEATSIITAYLIWTFRQATGCTNPAFPNLLMHPVS